jgi:hypothetical protein
MKLLLIAFLLNVSFFAQSAEVPLDTLLDKSIPEAPNDKLTPGVCDPHISLKVLCSQKTSERRLVTDSTKKKVAESYGIPWEKHSLYEFDHLCPLELGGENVQTNLWPQLWKWAHLKDKVENRLHQMVCSKKMDLKTAQDIVIHDWYSFYREHEVKDKPAKPPVKKKS